MVVIQNHLGDIKISRQYLTALIGGTVTNCFGVVDMNASSMKQSLLSKIPVPGKKVTFDKGVEVKYIHNKLYIDLHITVMYGINVSTVVKSIIDKVRYSVEEQTEITVANVNVFVDSIKI